MSTLLKFMLTALVAFSAGTCLGMVLIAMQPMPTPQVSCKLTRPTIEVTPLDDWLCDTPSLRLWMYEKVPEIEFTYDYAPNTVSKDMRLIHCHEEFSDEAE